MVRFERESLLQLVSWFFKEEQILPCKLTCVVERKSNVKIEEALNSPRLCRDHGNTEPSVCCNHGNAESAKKMSQQGAMLQSYNNELIKSELEKTSCVAERERE